MSNTELSNLNALLARMDDAPGFAGLGSTIQTISQMGDDDDPRQITMAILRDAALTGKLMRIANSSRRGGRNVTTIDQAIVILGLNTVKSVAMSMAMLESLSNQPQSKQLHAEIVAAYFCSVLAFEITRLNAPRFNAQEAQVCGLMQNLGRMMVTYYQFEKVEEMRALQAERNITEEASAQIVFGMGFDAISAAIAKHWSLPDLLQKSLEPNIGKTPPKAAAADTLTWHQLCAIFSRQVTDSLFRSPLNLEKMEISQHLDFFRIALQLRENDTREIIDNAMQETGYLLEDIHFPCTIEQARNLLHKASERVLDRLSSNDSLTKVAKDEEAKAPIEIIQTVLRHLHDGLGFDRTLLCLPQGTSGLVAIAGVGRNASQVVSKFRCLSAKPDVFRIVTQKKIDMFLADIHQASYAKFIPDWYFDTVDAKSVQLISLLYQGQCIGLLYGDFSEAQQRAPDLNNDRVHTWKAQLIQALQMGSKK